MLSLTVVLTFFSLVRGIHLHEENSEPSEKSFAWGPGLEPALVLPVRYFFIQSVDSAGRNVSKISVSQPFELIIASLSGHCGISQQLLDRKDGTYIARYRIYNSCQGLRIEVRLTNGKHIVGSPWVYRGTVTHTDCVAPLPLANWKKVALCPSSIPQIDRDVANFMDETPLDITDHFSKLSAKFHPQSASFCHYIIKDNLLHRKCFGEHVDFTMFMDAVLLFVLRRAVVPDVNFIVNLGDYPLSQRRQDHSGKIPVFSWCSSTEAFDIVMPTYDVTESSLTAMDRVLLDLLSVQAPQTPAWSEKIPQAFWRGRDAREERLRLVELAREHPDLIDAGLTNFFFFRDQEAKYGPKTEHVNFFQFFKFKYQINLDGTVAAYRFPYLLAGDGVVFKQESHYYEHFYHELTPWEHYIPVQRNLSDLIGKIRWAKDNDEAARKISIQGSDFTRNHLLPHSVFCYYTLLLEKWSSFVIPIEHVPLDYQVIPQVPPPQGDAACDAQMSLSSGDDLELAAIDVAKNRKTEL